MPAVIFCTKSAAHDVFPHLPTQMQRIRDEVFLEELGWDLPVNKTGSEEDEFDSAAVYVAVVDTSTARDVCPEEEVVCGMFRLLHGTNSIMLRDVPTMRQLVDLQHEWLLNPRPDVYEMSRLAFLSTIAPARKRIYLVQLLMGGMCWGLRNGVRTLVGATYCTLIDSVAAAGFPVETIGPAMTFDDEERACQAFMMSIDTMTYTKLKQKYNRFVAGTMVFSSTN
jgi:N-acyl-L-homoserine lactone synthetase